MSFAALALLAAGVACGGGRGPGVASGGSGGQSQGGSSAGAGAGQSGSAWACAGEPSAGVAVPAQGAWFVDASAKAFAALPARATIGFGRPIVVDLDGDGFDDLVATPAHDGMHPDPPGDMDKLVLRNRGDGTFEDVTSRSGLAAAQVGLLVFGDVDGDGDQDAFAGTIEGKGVEHVGIWTNDGQGRFTFAGASGIKPKTLACGQSVCTQAMIGATFADLDGDGALDLYVGGWFWSDGKTTMRYNPPAKDDLYRGKGNGTFEDVSAKLGTQAHPRSGVSANFGRPMMGISAGDHDNDGRIDLFVSNYGVGRPVGPSSSMPLCEPPRYWDWNFLWRNAGGFELEDVAVAKGVAATAHGRTTPDEPPLVLGDACPMAVRGAYEGPIGGNHFTSQFGDFDNDGDLDLLVGAISHPDYPQSDPTGLLLNAGPPGYGFTDVAAARGLRVREDEKHVYWADLDGDGWLDIVTTGFRNPAENDLRIYHQKPDHTFELLTAAVSGVDDRMQEGLVLLDFDHDGDLDLVVAHDTGPMRLFENRSRNRRLEVRLVGKSPADATGARVLVETSAGTQLREIVSGNGHYNPQPSRGAYYGLAGDTCARRVAVRWPSGATQELGAVRADAAIEVTEMGAVRPLR